MKTRSTAVLLMAAKAVLLSTACTNTDFIVNPTPFDVHGNGIIVEESRPVSGCTRITLAGVGNLYIRQGAQEELRIRAEENLLEHLKIESRADELLIWKDAVTLRSTAPIEYHLTVVSLESAALTGAGWIRGMDLDTGPLELRLTGAGNVEFVNLNAPRLNVDASGVGEVTLSGSVQEQTITLRSLAKHDGRDLTSATADVLIASGGSATVRVRDHLRATIHGSGNVFYFGDPIVDSSISGSGKVVKMGE